MSRPGYGADHGSWPPGARGPAGADRRQVPQPVILAVRGHAQQRQHQGLVVRNRQRSLSLPPPAAHARDGGSVASRTPPSWVRGRATRPMRSPGPWLPALPRGLQRGLQATAAAPRKAAKRQMRAWINGRGGAIRTLDLLNPIQVRYQAAPRPVEPESSRDTVLAGLPRVGAPRVAAIYRPPSLPSIQPGLGRRLSSQGDPPEHGRVRDALAPIGMGRDAGRADWLNALCCPWASDRADIVSPRAARTCPAATFAGGYVWRRAPVSAGTFAGGHVCRPPTRPVAPANVGDPAARRSIRGRGA